jgi:hypothetical protein
MEQRERLFIQEACGNEPSALTPVQRGLLKQLDQLSLGDFAAVKQQLAILETEISPQEFLEQLTAEHRVKPLVRERRSMGFMS